MSPVRHHPHEHLHLPRWTRWTTYLGGALAAVSGIGWWILHHHLQREGEFGPEAHPFEHPALVVHGVVGLLLVWLFGVIWLPHVRRGWQMRHHRLVGGTMLALMLLLSLTAAGLYYLADEGWRAFAGNAHWYGGLLAVLWLPLHIVLGRAKVRRRIAAARG